MKMTKNKARIFRKKVIALITAITFTLQPMLVSAAVIVDQNASKNQPTVKTAPNGVPIVDIATPSNAGISHNYYQQFNVDKIGLIFNNSQGLSKTQLAGYILGNPSLANGTARIILNEVTSTNPSYLKGYSEVAGSNAEIIIANPNGIYGDGFGFINANRAILTTGKPIFGGDGSLEAFNVNRGNIQIQGAGLDACQIDQVDLLSKAIEVNAGIWAKNLNVIAGSNTIDHNTLATQKIASNQPQEQVAIDVGALGGMYANKIKLIGTETGVGVNLGGDLSAQNNIEISSAGKIKLTGNTVAKGDIKLTAQNDMDLSGNVNAQNNINLNSQGQINNTGSVISGGNNTIAAKSLLSTGNLGAGISSDNTLKATGDLSILTAETATLNGNNIAGGNLTVQGTAIDLSGAKTTAGGNVNLTATAGDINNTGAALQTDGALSIKAAQTIKNDKNANGIAGQITANAVTIVAQNISNRGGSIQQTGTAETVLTATNTIDNTGGIIETNGSTLNINSDSIDNTQGQILHAGSGKLRMNTTNKMTNNSGKIATNGQLDVTATDINNTGGVIRQTGTSETTLTATNTINNTGGIVTTNGSSVTMKADSIDNTQGQILHAGSGKLVVDTIGKMTNSSGKITTNGQLDVTAAEITNTGGSMTAQQDMNINSASVVNNQGLAAAGGNLKINAQNNLSNQHGTVQAGKNLTATAQNIANQQGSITSLDNSGLVMNATQNIDNTAGTIGGNGDVSMTTASLVNIAGKVLAKGDINANISNSLDNTNGKITAEKDVNIGKTAATSTIKTSQGSMSAGNNLSVNAASFNIAGGNLMANRDINLISNTLFGAGTITSGQDINFKLNGDFTYSPGMNFTANRDLNFNVANLTNYSKLSAVRNLKVSATNVTNGAGATLQGGTGLTISAAGDVSNSGTIQSGNVNLSGNTITNTSAVFGDTLTVTANTVQNNGDKAVIATTKEASFYAKTSLENKDGASIYSSGNINIAGSSKKDSNGEYIDKTNTVLNQSATIEADKDINISANTLTNKKREFVTGQKVVSDETYISLSEDEEGNPEFNWNKKYLIPGSSWRKCIGTHQSGDNAPSSPIYENGAIFLVGQTITETKIIKDSPEGKIISANNIKLVTDNVTNDNSSILAGATLSTVGTVNNIATGYVRVTTRHLADLSMGNHKKHINKRYDDTTSEQLPGQTAILGGGQAVTIQGTTINNITTSPVNTPTINSSVPLENTQTLLPVAKDTNTTSAKQTVAIQITLPSNAMFKINTEPSAHYLVETDSRFTNYGNFISSDYMLQKLNIDPAKTAKRLGDGFYEQKLVREQVTELTGRYTLSGYSSAEEQYKALLTNGATYAKEFNLQVGVALTAEQMAKLTSDIVWLVEKEVNGQKVLVPEVYLARSENIDLKANGAVIAADNVQINASSDVKNAGAIKATESVNIQAVNIGNYGGNIDGGKSTQLTADKNILNIGGSINGDQTQLVAGGDVKNETISSTRTLPFMTETTAGNTASINAGENLIIKAGNDITNTGAQITAGKDATIHADGNFTVDSVKEQDRLAMGSYLKDNVSNVVSSIHGGNNVSITSGKDTNLQGAQITADHDLTVAAGGNVNVSAVKDEDHFAEKSSNVRFSNVKSSSQDDVNNIVSHMQGGNNVSITSGKDTNLQGAQIAAGNDLTVAAGGNINISAVKDESIHDETVGISHGWKRTRTDDETVIGSTLQGGGAVTVKTTSKLPDGTTIPDSENRGNITIAGSNIESDKSTVTISADKNVTIQEVTEKHESLVQTHTKHSGFLSSSTTDTMDHSLINEVKGSTISGDQVTVSSGKDLTVQGSNVVGTNDVTLSASNDVNITSAKETGNDEHYSYTKKSGLLSGGGLGFTIGTQSTKTTTTDKTLDQVGSTVGSIDGNVTVTAGNKVNSAGTAFVTGEDLNIKGKDVTIDNTINTVDSQTKYEFKQTGLSVSLGGGVVDTGMSAYKNIERSGQVQDERLKDLYEYKAFKDIKDLKKTLDGGLTKDNLKNGVSINVSLGSTKITSTDTVHEETVNTSNINAGGNVNITATAGDVNLKGTKINAEDVTLDAKNNINIESAENKLQTTNNTSSSSASIGTSFGLTTGTFGGVSGNFQSSKSNENENVITNAGTSINASGTLTLNSGKDTNITGSQVKGDKVVATIGGDLNIASVQDTDNYTANNQSIGLGFSTDKVAGKPLDPGTSGPVNQTTATNVTGSSNKGKTDSTYASVVDQAGIFAGKDGFNITVGKNTDLKGAVISSDATPDKNKISTDTLTFSNMENRAQYNSSSKGVNLNTNPNAKLNQQGFTPNASMPVSGDASSTTKSAISPGAIEIRSNPKADLSGLSRDTTNSLNTLGKIFDKETVKEQQELAGLFGELAFEEVHKISKANGWDESSPQKIALHALIGGIMADLAGGSFASGAAGAGINEAIQKELAKITDPALHQWASYIIGSAVSGTVGGATAVSGTKNNLLAYFLTNTQDALKQALRAKNGENPTDQQVAELNAQISAALNVVFPDGRPTIEGETSVIRSVLQQNGIPSASIDDFVNVYTDQASVAVKQYNKTQVNLADIRTTAITDSISNNIKGTLDAVYLLTPEGQKNIVQALLNDPTLPITIGKEAYNSLKNWAGNIQGDSGDEVQAKAQGQLLGQVLTAYATAKGTSALKELVEMDTVVVTAPRFNGASNAFSRSANLTSDMDTSIFGKLKCNGTIDAGRSGTNRPFTSDSNSYFKTKAGNIIVYDNEGKLIYDINSQRVKIFDINVNPQGKEFFNPRKLDGVVPSEILELLK
jgi:filamentous hemagglutinin